MSVKIDQIICNPFFLVKLLGGSAICISAKTYERRPWSNFKKYIPDWFTKLVHDKEKNILKL